MKKSIWIFLLLLLPTIAFADLTIADGDGISFTQSGAGGTLTVSAYHLSQVTITVSSATSRLKDTADYKCDGTNDEVQIQAAIDEASALPTGGTVALLEGAFSISASIVPKANVWLKGQGIDETILAGQAALADTGVIQDWTHWHGDPLMNVIFSDFTIDGSAMNHVGYHVQRKGISVVSMREGIVKNIKVYDTPATGIAVDHAENTIIDGVFVDDCGTAGQYGSNGIGIGSYGDNLDQPEIIVNSILSNNANAGILLEAQVGATQENRNFIVSNNLCYGNYDGIRFSGTGQAIITNNETWLNTNDGISIINFTFADLPPHEFVVSGNSVHDNTVNGIEVTNEYTKNLVISNNSITSNGIGINSKAGQCIITGNLISGNQNQGIKIPLAHNVNLVKITNNMVIDNGKAETIGTNDGILVTIDADQTLNQLDISHNSVTDTSADAKKQRYGVNIVNSGTLTNYTMIGNNLVGNATGSYTSTNVADTSHFIWGNQGYASGSFIGFGTTSPAGLVHTATSLFASTPIFERNGLSDNGMYAAMRILATKTDNMGDGFGVSVNFNIKDDAGTNNTIGAFGAKRAGADNTGDLIFQTYTAGVLADKMKIKSDGALLLTSPDGTFWSCRPANDTGAWSCVAP